MINHERLVKLLLRIIGSAGLLAIGAVVMPYSWMNTIHLWLDMDELPNEPIVGYLARSTSAFYALLGGLMWIISFDLYRHHLVLCYLGTAILFFGGALLVIDIVKGLPFLWILFEGPPTLTFGVSFLIVCRRLKNAGRQGT